MSHSKPGFSARNEYFLACFFAVAVGLVRLGTHSQPGAGLFFLGVLILAIAIGVYYQFGRSLGSEGDRAKEGPGPARLYRMALIWHVLTLVLSGAFVRGLLQALGSGGGAEFGLSPWGMGLLGLGVAGFALWRILRIITMIKKH